MLSKYYAKGPGNEGHIKNLDVVAFNDLDGGSFFQMALHRTEEGRYYIYVTMGDTVGIIEVTDPERPRFVKRFKTVDNSTYPTTMNRD